MTNKFSSLRSTSSSPSFPLGPVRVYTKIIDWLQNSNTGAEGPGSNCQTAGIL
ncbi:MAG: hypothetical protein R3A12_18575 [Ignavibacteria bacterium]